MNEVDDAGGNLLLRAESGGSGKGKYKSGRTFITYVYLRRHESKLRNKTMESNHLKKSSCEKAFIVSSFGGGQPTSRSVCLWVIYRFVRCESS